MIALVGPRGNGRTKKLVQWAMASGGSIVVCDRRRGELLRTLGVPPEQILLARELLEPSRSQLASSLTLYAIDDVADVLGALVPALQTTPQLITFHGGAMTP